MNEDIKYMQRCLQLASNGLGHVSPNPMVGAVIVHDGIIIGEGFHRQYGKPHAEVNAINSVKDKSLLPHSVIYVSLEPCSHHGKTPPCAQLIVESKIPKVVVAMLDPYHQVSGRGIKILREAGIEVEVGVLEEEARKLNSAFVSAHVRHRPYIVLKWAETKDGFIDKERQVGDPPHPTPISNSFTRMLVHKLRSEIPAIMVGTNTAVKDNPSLTTRYWHGKNPTRIVFDRQGRIPSDSHIFNDKAKTLVFVDERGEERQVGKSQFIPVKFDDSLLDNILKSLHRHKIDAVLVEGGFHLLQSFIKEGLWDEAFVEVAYIEFKQGVPAPEIEGNILDEKMFNGSRQIHLLNNNL